MPRARHRIPSPVSLDEAIEFIVERAATADGVGIDDVAKLCGLEADAARNRFTAAMEAHPALIYVTRQAGLGRAIEHRWFLHEHWADAWVAGRGQGGAGERVLVSTVPLPTHSLPPASRAGADDHRQCASRRGDWLYFLDGRRERISAAA